MARGVFKLLEPSAIDTLLACNVRIDVLHNNYIITIIIMKCTTFSWIISACAHGVNS